MLICYEISKLVQDKTLYFRYLRNWTPIDKRETKNKLIWIGSIIGLLNLLRMTETLILI